MRGDRVLPGFFHAVALVTRVVVLCRPIFMPNFAISMVHVHFAIGPIACVLYHED